MKLVEFLPGGFPPFVIVRREVAQVHALRALLRTFDLYKGQSDCAVRHLAQKLFAGQVGEKVLADDFHGQGWGGLRTGP